MPQESPKFQIEPIIPSDEADVRAFLTKAIARPGAELAMPDGWLAWMAAGAVTIGLPEIGVGWKLVVAGEVGGVHLMVPFRAVAADGTEGVSVQSSGFYVAPQWHGPASGALFLTLMKHRPRFHCSVSTANKAASDVWKAFRGEFNQGSDQEYCRMAPRPSLLEEAVARRVPLVARLLQHSNPSVRVSLSRRLASLRSRLGGALAAFGPAAVDAAVGLQWHGAGVIPSEALLRWKLSSPVPWHDLLILQSGGRSFAAFVTGAARGHRGQVATLTVCAVWGPAWDENPRSAISVILDAARRDFPFITLGFSPVPDSVQSLFRRRMLDAPRRWLVRSPGQSPLLPGWNDLNSL